MFEEKFCHCFIAITILQATFSIVVPICLIDAVTNILIIHLLVQLHLGPYEALQGGICHILAIVETKINGETH